MVILYWIVITTLLQSLQTIESHFYAGPDTAQEIKLTKNNKEKYPAELKSKINYIGEIGKISGVRTWSD